MRKGLVVSCEEYGFHTVAYYDAGGKLKLLSLINNDNSKKTHQFEIGEIVDVYHDEIVKSECPEFFDFNNSEVLGILTEHLAQSAVICRELRLMRQNYRQKGKDVLASECDESIRSMEDSVRKLLNKITSASCKEALDAKKLDLVRNVSRKIKFILGGNE